MLRGHSNADGRRLTHMLEREHTDTCSPEELASQLLIEQLMSIARVSALEEMASGIAHELNQPLGAIATFAQAGERMLTRPEPMTSAALEVLHHINDEALNAGEGIRRIRKLFNHVGERTTTSVEQIVTELRPVLEMLASRGGAQLTIQCDGPFPVVNVEKLRIQHVLLTLVQNAIEASSGPGRQSHVMIEVTTNRYTVEVGVTDNGPGIPEQARTQVFRPFFTTKRYGTGLGLASSRAIVEAHHGTIGFTPAEDIGTRFWFRLPAAT